jgi:hypothetical protein
MKFDRLTVTGNTLMLYFKDELVEVMLRRGGGWERVRVKSGGQEKLGQMPQVRSGTKTGMVKELKYEPVEHIA